MHIPITICITSSDMRSDECSVNFCEVRSHTVVSSHCGSACYDNLTDAVLILFFGVPISGFLV